jgi:hypothetical protein
MAGSEELRRMAERLLAAAMQSPDRQIAHELTARASEYLDQASALEAGRPAPKTAEPVAREADEPQPNEKKE